MANFRSFWYKFKLNIFSVKTILIVLLVFSLYREFSLDRSEKTDKGLAKVPGHRKENLTKKQLKKIKKKEKKQKAKQKAQEKFENIENFVENDENHRLEGTGFFFDF